MRLIEQHLDYLRDRLLTYYKHLNLGKHPDVIGQAREGIVKLFLKDNLPSLVNYFTGEIIDWTDERSGQIDIILQSALSPKLNLFGDIHISLNDSVLAAIEIKSNLTTGAWTKNSHLKSALESIKKIKSLKKIEPIIAKKSVDIEFTKTPCFIFAYKGPALKTLVNKLIDFGVHHGLEHEDYWPEVIVVLDQNYSIARNDNFLFSPTPTSTSSENPAYTVSNKVETPCLTFFYVYLCGLIELWNSEFRPTHFSEYVYEEKKITNNRRTKH
jgi:hypothetical protein